MKRKPLIILLVLFITLAEAGGGAFLFYKSQTKPPAAVEDKLFGWKFPASQFPLTGGDGKLIAYSTIRDPGGEPRGLPVRLKIPVIGVDAIVEDALITPEGRMDVPAGSTNVAWFSLGPPPGQVGSAVIGGHFGITNGVPWVFYNLDKVKVGDKVYIVDDKNETLAFVVRDIKLFDRNADATTVFTSQDGKAHLNVITCEGIWNQVNGTYPSRRVVFTDAIPHEEAAAVTPRVPVSSPIATKRSFPETNQSVQPTLTSKETITTSNNEKKPLSPQLLIAAAKSLYATPLDAGITSILLLSIAFIVFRIIKLKRRMSLSYKN